MFLCRGRAADTSGLAIDESSFGREHPEVAIRLNTLTLLLQATNRLAEAEPLMRRHLAIFLNVTRQTGHSHPHLQAALGNYAGLLQEMGLSDAEVRQKLNDLRAEYGMAPE